MEENKKNAIHVLVHHGILGMKWGVRRYQTKDGSYTAAGRNRYGVTEKQRAKNVKKAYKKTKPSYSQPYSTSEKFESDITEAVKQVATKEDVQNIRNKYKVAKDLYNKSEKAEKQYDMECYKQAYDECYKWFEKNDPKYLNEIIKNNNGEKAGLDAFHDFDTAMDGYLDDVHSRTEKEFHKQHPEVKQADKAWDEYIESAKQMTNKLLGEYGNKKVNGEELNDIVYWNTNIQSIINDTLYKK